MLLQCYNIKDQVNKVVFTQDGNVRIYFKNGTWREFSPITDNRLHEMRCDEYNHDYYMDLWKDAIAANETTDSFEDYLSQVKEDLFDENDPTDFPNKTYNGEFDSLEMDNEIKETWKDKFGERVLTWDFLDMGRAEDDKETEFVWEKTL